MGLCGMRRCFIFLRGFRQPGLRGEIEVLGIGCDPLFWGGRSVLRGLGLRASGLGVLRLRVSASGEMGTMREGLED